MKNNITSLFEKIKRGDLSGKMTKVQVLGLPGLTWFSRSEFKKAQKELKKALAQVAKREGPDHPVTALIHYFLGEAYMHHNRSESAETHLLRATEIWAHSDADNYRGMIHKLLDLARAYGESRRLSDSERLKKTIVDSVKHHLSEGDPLIVCALADLAAAVLAQGRTSKAEDLLQEALNQSEKYPETLSGFGPRILTNLAGVSTARVEFRKAELYLSRALDMAKAAAEPDQGHIIQILSNQARLYAVLGKQEELGGATAEAQIAYENIWESEPELVIPCMFDLVRFHERLGNNDTARKIFSRLAEDMAAVMNGGNEEELETVIDIWLEDIAGKGATDIFTENARSAGYSLDNGRNLRKYIASLGSKQRDARGNRDQAKTRRRT